MVESFCYGELGLKPKDFYRLTLREYELMHDGYNRKIKIQSTNNLEMWRQARMIAYNVAWPNLKDKNISVYDYLPLKDDPTEKQKAKAQEKQRKKDEQWMKDVIKNFREKQIM